VFVHAAYVPTTVVYVPPLPAQLPAQVPAQVPVYAPTPGYVVPSVAVVAPVLPQPLPAAAVPIPLPVTTVAVAAPAAITPGYALVPAQHIAYAQPVLAVPVAATR
jgi:hypothetical protein